MQVHIYIYIFSSFHYYAKSLLLCNSVLCAVNIWVNSVDAILKLPLLSSSVSSVQFSCSVMSDSLWPQGLERARPPIHYQLSELSWTHVHRVSDAIQPSHRLSSMFPPAFNLSQHRSLFQWVSSSHQVAKVLEFQLQRQSFQWLFRTDFLPTPILCWCFPVASWMTGLLP